MYIVDSLDVILKEENCRDQKINEIAFITEIKGDSDERNKPDYQFDLRFCKKNGTNLKIAGLDRDFVFLLKSDLKNYLDNNVIKKVFFNKTDDFKASLTFLIILTAIVFSWITISYSKSNLTDILSTEDINAKLNFLIQKSSFNWKSIEGKLIVLLFGFLVLTIPAMVFNPISSMQKFLFPTNIFYYEYPLMYLIFLNFEKKRDELCKVC
ncbi:MAG: hypothetical protein JXC36_05750 [Candidatus Atribacteria bacterium]|nr:hypothetical protein [Candidatus Atribacteria bacterium]